ncbi:MAG TPA: hypothetical protein VMD91_11435 [Candidatus Sulfotelmatobacter sp.]|nr:hypothetical protein [Candidatus Sulfotelmatobacter sp.]
MKRRIPPWVWILAACLPLAVLVLVVYAIGRSGVPARARAPHVADETPPSPPPEASAGPEPPPPAPSPVPAPPPPPNVPLFGPPPERPGTPEPVAEESVPAASTAAPDRVPGFIAEAADPTAQLARGTGADAFVFGFYADGSIRFADVDGGCYAGKAESARARLREVGGTRAFTVQIGVGIDGGLQATFTGGLHEGETLALVPLVGWSVA